MLSIEEAGEPGWWLVRRPHEDLDELARTEGIEWRELPTVRLLSSSGGDDPIATPDAIDGDPCTFTPAPDTFCPYDVTTSTTEPMINCNTSILAELYGAPATYGASIVEVVDLGYTYENRPVRAVRLGKRWTSGSPVRQVVVYATQHAREWVTAELTMRLFRDYASKLATGDPTVQALLANTALLIIPVANPDGYAFSHADAAAGRTWRKNREPCSPTHKGTDPNRNFPFSWGEPGASDVCSIEDFRGAAASSAAETAALTNALVGSPSHYRTVAGINLHSFGNHLLAPEGFSSGFSPCTTDTNCMAPDLGVFHLLAGTERDPRMRDEESGRPYIAQQAFRGLYDVAGDSANETLYGALGGAPQFLSLSAELTHTECGHELENTDPAQIGSLYSSSFRPWMDHLLAQAATLETGAGLPSFDLPVLHRRRVEGTGAEFPTVRVAVRNSLSGTSLTGVGVSGTAAADDMLSGVYYREWRWRPSAPYLIPGRVTVCASGVKCRDARIEGTATSFDLCKASRFTVGSGWSFFGDALGGPQDECFWRFTSTGSSPWRLTGTARDLSTTRQTRLVYSYRWTNSTVTSARVIVSSNNFVSCSHTGYGACRIVRDFPYGSSNIDLREPLDYRTGVIDVSDFDGKPSVQVRFEVLAAGSIGGEDFTIHDPVFVGWAL